MKIVAINPMDSDVSKFFFPKPKQTDPSCGHRPALNNFRKPCVVEGKPFGIRRRCSTLYPFGRGTFFHSCTFCLGTGHMFWGVNLLFLLCSMMYLQPLISKPHRSCAPIGNQMILIAIAKSGKNNALIVTSDVKKCGGLSGLPVIHSSIFVLPFWVSRGLLRHWELWVIFFPVCSLLLECLS